MKKLISVAVIAVALVSCGQNDAEKAQKAKQDSIAKVDSLLKAKVKQDSIAIAKADSAKVVLEAVLEDLKATGYILKTLKQ